MSADISWVTISRYLGKPRAQRLARKLEGAGIAVRVDPEGSTDEDLYRLRVPLEQATSVFEVLVEEVSEKFRWPPPRAAKPGVVQKIRRLVASALRPSASSEDFDTSVEAALRLVRRDPASPRYLLLLARALLSADESDLGNTPSQKALEWARYALDEAIFLGAGSEAAFEMAELCLEQELPEEAAAWIEEASASTADPPRAAYLRCELEFQRGDLKALKNAVSGYRRLLGSPDLNLVYAASLLYAAGEKGNAVRIADTALRDGEFASDEDWISAAALKVAMEGAQRESVADLASFLSGEEAATKAVANAQHDLNELTRKWKSAVGSAKKGRVKKKSSGGTRR